MLFRNAARLSVMVENRTVVVGDDYMKWSKHEPAKPGLYWYRHTSKHTPEVVKVTSEGCVFFLGDWRARAVTDLDGVLWGDPVALPEYEKGAA
jgi:hypothetical protein